MSPAELTQMTLDKKQKQNQFKLVHRTEPVKPETFPSLAIREF